MSVQKISLFNPIEINGRTCKDLTYDTDQLTIAQFADAEAAAKRKAQNVVAIAEFDYTLHFYLAAYSIIAVNPDIDITDVERIKGRDIMSLVEVGRFFTMRSDEQEQSTSDEQPATIPANTTQASKTSEKCD